MLPEKCRRLYQGLIVAIVMGLTAGCVNVTTTPMFEDQTVQPQVSGEDCAYMAFGFFMGNAKADVAKTAQFIIQRVRRVDIEDLGFLGFGYRCVVVTGETKAGQQPRPLTPE